MTEFWTFELPTELATTMDDLTTQPDNEVNSTISTRVSRSKRFKRWVLSIAVGAALGYVEGPVAIHLMYRIGEAYGSPRNMRMINQFADVADFIYYPLEMARYNSDYVAVFYNEQLAYVDRWFYDA